MAPIVKEAPAKIITACKHDIIQSAVLGNAQHESKKVSPLSEQMHLACGAEGLEI